MAETTLVIEARHHSGSLITANLALQENRNVLAVPGSITSPLSVGTNELLLAGAKPVLKAQDIIEEFLNT
nr:DNA-processing protein DprA [Liquorilactobacillus satsumensis]